MLTTARTARVRDASIVLTPGLIAVRATTRSDESWCGSGGGQIHGEPTSLAGTIFMANGKPHFVLAGGGTGGHLFPGLAVAEALFREHPLARITVAGRGDPFEQGHVDRAGFDYLGIPCQPLRGMSWKTVRSLCEHVAAYRQAAQFLERERASVVVGLGGYVSVPTVRAALSLKIPVVLLEQNAVPGRANTWLARGARLICAAYDTVRPLLPGAAPLRITGNPIRRSLAEAADREPGPIEGRRRIVVLGGSLGSDTLNRQAPRALYKVRQRLADWEIVHQTGVKGLEPTKELYRKFALRATVVPFIDDMAEALAGAGAAISRSGGTTLAELSATGVPAVLVPYGLATDDHQRKNADIFVAAGAARLVDPRDIEGRVDDSLAAELTGMLGDGQVRGEMSEAMLRRARPEAATHVASLVAEIAERRVRQMAG